jgi:hypothetical protein
MKNFIFISPNFPAIYWRFCAELKNNGLRVLGIGDCPYDQLSWELKDSLHEYYKVSSLEDYNEMFRAVAFFSFKYGKIDWLESNNEYWLERDAQLRTDFHITTGFHAEQMESVKCKSAMKAYYAKAGIPTARYHLVRDYEGAKAFANQVGYPVIVKPDNGVGASHTYRLHNDNDLNYFFATKDDNLYIMEEMVKGYVCTYDAIVGAQGQPLFEASNVTPHSLMDVVNECGESLMYLVKEVPADLRDAGLRTIEAFGVKSRFVHLEFFRLTQDQPGLGKVGDIVGLEVNMRPAGGYIPDMYNFSAETDVYKIWADMIAFDYSTKPVGNHHYCAFCGRRDGKHYRYDHNAILSMYGSAMMMERRIPDALADCMGNHMYVVNVETEEELQNFFRNLLA